MVRSRLFIANVLQSDFILLDLARRSTSPSTEASLGLTGLEPVTLRLSSACSNQLSYRPGIKSQRVRMRPRSLEKTQGTFVGQTSLLRKLSQAKQTLPDLKIKGANFWR